MPKRTAPITIIGVFFALQGVFFFIMAMLGLMMSSESASLSKELAELTAQAEAAGAAPIGLSDTSGTELMLRFIWMAALVLGPVLIATGIGVLRLAPWGRVLALLVGWVAVVLTPVAAIEHWSRTGTVDLPIDTVLYWILVLAVMHSTETRARFVPRLRADDGLPDGARLAPIT